MAGSHLSESLAAYIADASIALTVADGLREDNPLVAVNRRFVELTGYGEDFCIGKNCRFLQAEQGAGPVRERIRQFLRDDEQTDGRFVIPNVTFDNRPFLNLVYMAKIGIEGQVSFILGSQFDLSERSREAADRYDEALTKDCSAINLIAGEHGRALMGTLDAVANTAAIVARHRAETP